VPILRVIFKMCFKTLRNGVVPESNLRQDPADRPIFIKIQGFMEKWYLLISEWLLALQKELRPHVIRIE